MANKRLPNIHPGEVLNEEFLVPLGISQHALALAMGVPATRISDIVRGRRSISADTALRLGRYFDTSPQFWLNLQVLFDLEEAAMAAGASLDRIAPVRHVAAS